MNFKLIYVCSPLRGDIKKNIENAKRYSKYVTKKGGIPITPHLYFTTFLDDNHAPDRILGMKMGLRLINKCHELWVFGKVTTEGMAEEIERAKRERIPIKRLII